MDRGLHRGELVSFEGKNQGLIGIWQKMEHLLLGKHEVDVSERVKKHHSTTLE